MLGLTAGCTPMPMSLAVALLLANGGQYVRECSALINQFKDAEMALKKNNETFDTE